MLRFRGAHYLAPKGGADRLMSEAHAQNGQLAGEVTDQRDADARLVGRAGARRNHNPCRPQPLDISQRHLVVAPHLDGFAQLAQVLCEVVGERIVVVQNKDHLYGYRFVAKRTAASNAAALFSHSWNSSAGSESATTPAPAWM